MPRGVPSSRLTQARVEWLEHLEANGSASRDGWHQVPYACWRNGWTRWADPKNADGREELTEEGREVLRQWRLHD